MKIGIIGGTGPAGKGLALRLSSVGYEVEIGSRSSGRAAEVVEDTLEQWEGSNFKLSGVSKFFGNESSVIVPVTLVIIKLLTVFSSSLMFPGHS